MISFRPLMNSDRFLHRESIRFQHGARQRWWASRPSGDLRALRAKLGPGYAVVSLDVEGQPLRLMVDTAARSIIRLAPRVRDRLAGLRKLSERGSATRAAQLR